MKHENGDIVMGGDFNLVLEEKDAINRKHNNYRAQAVLKAFMNEIMLIDAWREKQGERFEFTYSRKRPYEMYARLDYVLVDYGLLGQVSNAKHIPAFKWDHSAVVVDLDLNPDFKRGPGFWKLNESILFDNENIQKLNSVIEQIEQKDRVESYEKSMKWELMKESIVKECKIISRERAEKYKRKFNELMQNVQYITDRMQQQGLTNIEKDVLEEQYHEQSNALQRYVEYKARGTRIHSRCRWQQEGELSTKYFLGLERTKYKNKMLKEVIRNDGSITRDEKEILNEQRKFYKKLYTADPEVLFTFKNLEGIKHSDEEKKNINKDFTFEEFTSALHSVVGQ